MINYKVKNIVKEADMRNLAFKGKVGEVFDSFIENRITSDFAVKEILKEAEDAFLDKVDDIDAPLGRWRGEFWGKLTISACRVAKYKNSTEIREIIKNSTMKVISTADESGYIGSYKNPEMVLPCPRDKGKEILGWPADWCWNIWCRKYTLWGLLEAYQLLGDKEILTAAVKFTDQLIDMLERLGLHVCETGTFLGVASASILKPVLILYQLTEEERYLRFALKIAEGFEGNANCAHLIKNALQKLPPHLWNCDGYSDAADYNMSLSHKAYETMSCFDGIIELYRITGDEKYLTAAENFWELLMKYEFNPVMSVGFNDIFLFAKSNIDAASEPCDVIHFIRITTELYKLTGNKKYIDTVEFSFENALLASMDRDGRWGARIIRGNSWHVSAEAQCGYLHNHCCVNNLPRGFLNVAEMIASLRGDRIYVDIYTPSKIKIGNLNIEISDGYLQYQKLDVKVVADKETEINFRLPSWSKSMTVNGKAAEIVEGYCQVIVPLGTNTLTLEFDHDLRIIEPATRLEVYPLTAYKRLRLLSAHDKDPDIIPVKEERAFLMAGPLLLAKSKQVGCSFDEMFDTSTIYGQNPELKLEAAPNENVRAAFKVQLEDKKITVCDYAWAGNLNQQEMFSIYF